MGLIKKILKPASEAYHTVAQLAGHESPRAPMQRNSQAFRLAQQVAKAGYQASPLAPYMNFTTKPSVGNLLLAALSTPAGAGGAAPAVAITTKATALRKALGLANTGRDAAIAREFAQAADIPMLQLRNDARDLVLKATPEAKHGVQPGGIYRIPATSEHGQFVDNRLAILQDPKTGTMFLAPKVIHADMIRYIKQHLPQFDRGPAGYLQHEMYAGEQIMPGVHTPPRWMTGAGTGHAAKDTEEATIARAQFLRNLQRVGALGDIKSSVAAAKAAREAMLRRRARG